MTSTTPLAPWHTTSFYQFLYESFPQLLATTFPLIGYTVTPTTTYTYQIHITLATGQGDTTVVYADLPQPDQEGVFSIQEQPVVVMPYATSDNLANAEIRCVGDQLLEFCQQRLRYQAPSDLPWNEDLVRAWLPIDSWMQDFFTYDPTSIAGLIHRLNDTNWLARQGQLRMLSIQNRTQLFTPGHFGRTCPFETPEGPNIGRILHIARGAEIRDRKLVIVDSSPEAMPGLSASMIPLLEHNHPRGLLMGANMQRQWLPAPDPEPALVQSGNEPDVPEFWCGRNLLTAFVSWGADTFAEGIVISASCAQRLNYPYPAEAGDKLSNRYGTKGVVSRVLPDDEMPHLPDGRPVELIFNPIATHNRLFFGEIREALLGRIAYLESEPLIIHPFHAPGEAELHARLAKLGLPEDGMEILTHGKDGPPLEQSVLVGHVYWGRLIHLARPKQWTSAGKGQGQLQENYELYALRDAGAFENAREHIHTRAIPPGNMDHDALLAERLQSGKQMPPPSQRFQALTQRLACVGIQVTLDNEQLSFHLAHPSGETLRLARPVAHPWLRGHTLDHIGISEISQTLPEYKTLLEANTRLERIVSVSGPDSLVQPAFTHLTARVKAFCEALVTPQQLQFSARVLSSGRAVVTPGSHLRAYQIGLPEDMAWELFGPLLARQIKPELIKQRSEQAGHELDELMARSWVLVHRALTVGPQSFVASRPVRQPGYAVSLHPLVSRVIEADFDGDQVAIHLPITPAAQQEAGQRLTLEGHLKHDPDLLTILTPVGEALWGLARLDQNEQGHQELTRLLEETGEPGTITRNNLLARLRYTLVNSGPTTTLALLEQLWQRGFTQTQQAGYSINPFIGKSLTVPPPPTAPDETAWSHYQAEVGELLLAHSNTAGSDIAPQQLAIKSGARGDLQHMQELLCGPGIVRDISNELLAIPHGYRDGLTMEELSAVAVAARQDIADMHTELDRLEENLKTRGMSRSFTVLARAMRARHPGTVFAHAALFGERDPLQDVDSRLFVGLTPKQ